MNRSTRGRLGAHTSWARTADRSARTANARRSSPGAIDWHLDRQTGDLAAAPMPERIKAAEAGVRAHMLRMAEARWGAKRGAAA